MVSKSGRSRDAARRPSPQETLPDMLRRIQLSAALAVGGLALVAALADDPKAVKPTTKHQNYTETLDGPEGKVSFDMIAIPGGQFELGSSQAEEERKEDE